MHVDRNTFNLVCFYIFGAIIALNTLYGYKLVINILYKLLDVINKTANYPVNGSGSKPQIQRLEVRMLIGAHPKKDTYSVASNEHIMTELSVWWQHLLPQGDIDTDIY